MNETEPDTDESIDQDEPEQPSIDDEEMADISAVAEEVEADAGAADEDGDADDQDDHDDADLELDPDEAKTSIGDVYCNVLGMASTVAKDRYGSGLEDGRDRKDALDDYAEIARDLEIDDAVDDLIEEYGGPDELTPGQTVLVMSVVFAGVVAMEDPAIIEGIAEGGSNP
jgi:hypothetical protein